MMDFAVLDWWTDFAENWINAMTPKADPSPEDRDTENPDIETPVPVVDTDWMDELKYYHSHLCECPLCAEAEQQRQSRIKDFMRIASQW